jgi:hypothetical protein
MDAHKDSITCVVLPTPVKASPRLWQVRNELQIQDVDRTRDAGRCDPDSFEASRTGYLLQAPYESGLDLRADRAILDLETRRRTSRMF